MIFELLICGAALGAGCTEYRDGPTGRLVYRHCDDPQSAYRPVVALPTLVAPCPTMFNPGWGECGYATRLTQTRTGGDYIDNGPVVARCTERAWPVGVAEASVGGSTGYEDPNHYFLCDTKPTGKTVTLYEVVQMNRFSGKPERSGYPSYWEPAHDPHITRRETATDSVWNERTGKTMEARVVRLLDRTERRIQLACPAGHLTYRKVKGEQKR